MKRGIKIKVLKFILTLTLLLIIEGVIMVIVVFYSPYTDMKDLWVTTAMSTMDHQYLAKTFVSEDEIEEIMKNNKVVDMYENVDETKISVKETEDLNVGKIDIKGKGYEGILLIVPDPSRVFVGTANVSTGKGMFLKDMVKKYNAIGGMNAGGFLDQHSQHGDGRVADGLLISEGVIIKGTDNILYNLIGFTEDDKLILGTYNLTQIKKLNIRDAVSFSPALIVNGKPARVIGNGGWGVQPRTAIGQRKDGTVLLLTIDGRQVRSIGASIKQVQDIMLENGAVNATNLDGGSSTVMVYDGEIINTPSSVSTGRFLPDAFIIKR